MQSIHRYGSLSSVIVMRIQFIAMCIFMSLINGHLATRTGLSTIFCNVYWVPNHNAHYCNRWPVLRFLFSSWDLNRLSRFHFIIVINQSNYNICYKYAFWLASWQQAFGGHWKIRTAGPTIGAWHSAGGALVLSFRASSGTNQILNLLKI